MTTFQYITAQLAVDRTQNKLDQLYKSRSAITEISDAIAMLRIAHNALAQLIAEATSSELSIYALKWF